MNYNKKTSAAIAALTLTAILLGVILLATPQQQVQAAMLNDQTNFSLMTAGVMGGDESLIIIDKNSQKIVIYTMVVGRGNSMNFNLVGAGNFAPPAPHGPGKK